MFDPIEYIKTSTDKNFLISMRDKFIPIDRANAELETNPAKKEEQLKLVNLLSDTVNKRLEELN